MTKLILVLGVAMLSLSSLTAQITEFKKGDIEIAAGLGLIPTFAADQANVSVPPLSIRAGYRILHHFSLSAYAAYSVSETDQITLPTGSVTHYESKLLMLGLRAAVHINQVDNLDFYGGFMLGRNIPTVEENLLIQGKTDGDELQPSFGRPAESTSTFGGFVGVSFYFKKNLGAFAELGYGISLLNMGVNFKL